MQVSIKAARVNAKIIQKDAAKLLKIDPSTLSKWENEKGVPDAISLKKLCNIYGVSVDDIFLQRKSILN